MVRVCVALGLCFIASVSGFATFRDQIPNGKKVPHPCKPNYVWKGVGHENELGGGARNPFGRDWYINGKKWDKCLCETDSDGDGWTNGEELGDPDCKWERGKIPDTTQKLSHPGICEPIDSEHCLGRNSWDIDCSLEEFECDELETTEDVRSITAKMTTTKVPPEETTYICQFIDLNISHDEDFHMIASEPFIDNEYVMHHLILYGCPDENADSARERFENPTFCGMEAFLCPRMITLWAVGSSGLCLAPEFGVRLGKNGFKYALMEMHWNNPEMKDDYSDGSGIILHYTPNLREYDGSTFFSGPFFLELPPGYSSITDEGTCPAECTEHMFAETIKISAIVPHMHYLGRKMVVEQLRDGELVRTILEENDYSYDDPQTYVYSKPVELEPGDEIRVVCTFDTSTARGVTYFGEATSDEMCLAIIQYYPLQANHSDCIISDGFGNCGKGFFNWEEALSCYFSLEAMLNATSVFWSYWYPQVGAECDPFGIECYPGCQDILDQLAEEYICFQGNNIIILKNVLLEYKEVVPQEVFGYLASCSEKSDHWIPADVTSGEVISDDESVCVLPLAAGANIRFSHALIFSALVVLKLLY